MSKPDTHRCTPDAAMRQAVDDRKAEAAYGENPFRYFRGSVTPEQVDGWGTGYRVYLWEHSEDGRQDEFSGVFLEREEADLVVAAWVTPSTRGLVWAIAKLERAS